MKLHPVCELFPPMSSSEFAALKDDILKHGVLEPVRVLDEQIVDGRHRWKACQELGIECPTTKVKLAKGESIVTYVASLNLHRRSLNISQRAVVGAKLAAELEKEAATRKTEGIREKSKGSGERQKTLTGKSAEIAAKAVGVSTRTVERAKAVGKESPKLLAEVAKGDKTLAEATRELHKDAEPAEEADPKGIPSAKPFRDLHARIHEIKREVESLGEKPEGAELRVERIRTDLTNAATAVLFAIPHCRCPLGINCRKGCKQCGGRGWINKATYDGLPKELKS